MTAATSIDDLLDRALAGYADLTALAEEVEDEWSYIQDLAGAWTTRLVGVRAERGGDVATLAVEAAVDRALEETAVVKDPHRAFDWLSTFPQVVLVALGERP